MLQPGLEPGCPGAEQVASALGDRRPVERRAQPPVRGDRADDAAHRIDALLVNDQVAPAEEVVQVEGAVAVRGPAEVVRADDHDRGDQLGRRVQGQGPLHEAEVAGPERGQPSVEPALAAQPGHGVLAVAGLAAHRLEPSAGAEGAAAALQQHVEAAFGDELGLQQAERGPASVGTAHQDRGGRLAGDRQVVVGQQHRAVGHRHLDVPLDRDEVPLRRERPGPGQHLAERGRGRPDGAGRSAIGALAHHAVPSAETTPAGRPALSGWGLSRSSLPGLSLPG